MKQMLKVAILIIMLTVCMSGCKPVEIHNIDEFSIYTSTVSLTAHLLPDEAFLDTYKYVDGNYHYYDNCKFVNSLELVLMELSYDAEIYEKAKNYCLELMYLSKENVKEYKDYVFMENLSYPEDYECLENGENKNFPHMFTMFAYNDTKHKLMFIGFNCSVELHEEVDDVATDWGEFLDKYYSEYYDFDK